MRLTAHTDYALRTLIYLAERQDRLVTIAEIADYHEIPKNHLTKVVHRLGQAGVLRTVRGRQGGIALGVAPEDIRIGAIVRDTEPDFCVAPCFAGGVAACPDAGRCGVQGVLGRATRAWLAELDGVTLAEVMQGQGARGASFNPEANPGVGPAGSDPGSCLGVSAHVRSGSI